MNLLCLSILAGSISLGPPSLDLNSDLCLLRDRSMWQLIRDEIRRQWRRLHKDWLQLCNACRPNGLHIVLIQQKDWLLHSGTEYLPFRREILLFALSGILLLFFLPRASLLYFFVSILCGIKSVRCNCNKSCTNLCSN